MSVALVGLLNLKDSDTHNTSLTECNVLNLCKGSAEGIKWWGAHRHYQTVKKKKSRAETEGGFPTLSFSVLTITAPGPHLAGCMCISTQLFKISEIQPTASYQSIINNSTWWIYIAFFEFSLISLINNCVRCFFGMLIRLVWIHHHQLFLAGSKFLLQKNSLALAWFMSAQKRMKKKYFAWIAAWVFVFTACTLTALTISYRFIVVSIIEHIYIPN